MWLLFLTLSTEVLLQPLTLFAMQFHWEAQICTDTKHRLLIETDVNYVWRLVMWAEAPAPVSRSSFVNCEGGRGGAGACIAFCIKGSGQVLVEFKPSFIYITPVHNNSWETLMWNQKVHKSFKDSTKDQGISNIAINKISVPVTAYFQVNHWRKLDSQHRGPKCCISLTVA